MPCKPKELHWIPALCQSQALQFCLQSLPWRVEAVRPPGSQWPDSLTEIVNSEFNENLPQKNKVEGLRRLSADLSEHPMYMNAHAGGTGKEASSRYMR